VHKLGEHKLSVFVLITFMLPLVKLIFFLKIIQTLLQLVDLDCYYTITVSYRILLGQLLIEKHFLGYAGIKYYIPIPDS